jgi:AcrR family transcriptional regulator
MATQKMRDRIIYATMALLAEEGWDAVSLEAIAARAGVSLAQLRDAYDGRVAILADLARKTDKAVLKSIDETMADEAPRERLFDVLYSRFEALEEYRPALRRLAGGVLRDPMLALELNGVVTGSMAWMLSAAGIDHTGPGGRLRAQGLAMVWGQVMRVWLDDDEPGHARTMAELDKRLRQAERTIMRLDRLRGLLPGRRRRAKPAAKDAPAEADA